MSDSLKQKTESLIERMKNPYFWIGIIGVIGTAMQIKPETLTSWEILGQAIKDLLGNPYMIGCVVLAIIGVFANPNQTKTKTK